jgi:heat shock protein HtpX
MGACAPRPGLAPTFGTGLAPTFDTGGGLCHNRIGMPAKGRPSEFGKDTGLQVRMLFTMFLLGLVYAALVGALFAAGVGGVVIAVVAGGLLVLQLFTSDKIALLTIGAREVSPQDEPVLHGIVERLCVQANLPKPRVAVIENQMPNACAMGKSPRSATVCATRGILDLLDPSELEGVIGHELTHVIHRDVMVMTLASFFASLAAMITQFAFFFGGFGFSREEEEGMLLVMLVSVLVYAISFLLLQALSRYREYAADRGSAILTGRPSALASALLKISGTMERIPQRDLRTAEGMSAFFIVPARAKQSLMNVFSDHPPLEKRLAQLSRLEAQLQGAR